MNNAYRDSLDDYAGYHRNPKNKVTHYVGIPMIVLAIICLLQRVVLMDVAGWSLNLAVLVLVPVSLYYLRLNTVTGAGMILIFVGMYLFTPMMTTLTAWFVFIVGWIFQFIGHHFEGNRPAFFQNAVHLLVGPMWILNDLFLKLRLPAYDPQKT